MNRATMTLALALFTCCSQACAQKSATTDKGTSGTATKAEVKSEPGTPIEKTDSQSSGKTGKPASTTKSDKPVAKPESTSSKNTSSKSVESKKADSKRSDGKGELTVEQEKRIKSLIRSTLRGFAKAELTDEQKSKADEILSKTTRDFVVKRDLAEITEEMQKQQAAAMKAKPGDKSAKEQADAAFASAGFTAEQIKVFKSTQTSMNKAKRDIGNLLTQEQIAKLSEPLQKVISGGK